MSILPAIAAEIRKQSRSIVFRLVGLAVFLVVFGALARIAVLSSVFKGEIAALLANHQLSLATYVANDIDEKIKARLGLLQRLANNLPPALLSDPEGLKAWLKERQDSFPLFSRGYAVVPMDGRGVVAEYPLLPGRRTLSYTKADWFLSARDEGVPTIGRPVRSPIDNEPVVVMAVPVRDASGAPVAVLTGVTDLAAPGFLNLVQENRIGRTGGFLLISPRDKLFVAAGDRSKILTETPPTGVNLLHDRAMEGYRGTGITVNATGVEELSAMVSVPTPGWFLVARLPTAEAFDVIRNMRDFILSNGLLALALVVVFLVGVLRRIFRPLIDAAKQMHHMAEGKAELAPLPVRRLDEVGDLAIGFNFLLGKLREQENALRESEARMAHMAHHDPLTGLANRAMFQDRLGQAIALSERNGMQFALLYMDLDGFKPINDTHGHGVGDEILCGVGRRLADLLGKADTAARLGGDEFAILLVEPACARPAAEALARACRKALAAPFLLGELTLTVGVSIGIALYPEDGTDANQLLTSADQTMYSVKRSAGTPVRVS